MLALCVQAMTWVNLAAMCFFLANAALGVVMAILEDLGIYPKAAKAHGNEDADEAWVEGESVPDEFRASRPVRHWRHGYGFAIMVEHEQPKPYVVCFESGLTKWYGLQRHALKAP